MPDRPLPRRDVIADALAPYFAADTAYEVAGVVADAQREHGREGWRGNGLVEADRGFPVHTVQALDSDVRVLVLDDPQPEDGDDA